MTKIRQPDSFSDAVHVIAAALTWEGAAAAIGKSVSLVRQFADPDAEAKPNIEQALKLDAAFAAHTGEPGPIGLLYCEQSKEHGNGEAHKPAPIHQRLCDLGKQVGDVYAATTQALEDGKVTSRERAAILRECGDVEQVIRKIKRDMKG
jgi:hypothetical protein